MANWLNTVCNFYFDFIGPSDTETATRKVKFPITNVTAYNTSAAVANALDILSVYKNEHVNLTAGADCTLNLAAASTPANGDTLICKIANDGTQRTITFGTGFKPTATVAGTINKTILVTFEYDGSYFWERSRSAAI